MRRSSKIEDREDDTVTAYERASEHRDAIDKSKAFFAKVLADERRRPQRMQETATDNERR